MDAKTIIQTVKSVTNRWAKQRRREERDANAALRRRQALTRGGRKKRVKDAAWPVIPRAYAAVSGPQNLPAAARQMMYESRGEIQESTGQVLSDDYFTQTLLPDYMAEHPEETANWDVTFDARGRFSEPHTNLIVPLGTIDVRRYLEASSTHAVREERFEFERRLYPTCGPENRFNAVVFIEKEGFAPLLRASNLARRYDIALMSTKGVSVTACRKLIDVMCSKHSIPCFVVRDFDKAGFTIAHTLQHDTRRYRFENKIEVIDWGLRLDDVERWNLLHKAEDWINNTSSKDPSVYLREAGATEEEIAFLIDGEQSWAKHWVGRRVELNAFRSADFIAWLESKLQEYGIRKVVPAEGILIHAYRRALQTKLANEHIASAAAAIRERAERAQLPDDLPTLVEEALRRNNALAWDEAIAKLVDEM